MAKSKRPPKKGPGLIYILVVLVAVAVVGARFFGFSPSPDSTDEPAPISDRQAQDESQEPSPSAPVTAGAQVLIYHTHTTENYKGKDPHEKKGPGDVVTVGKSVVDALRAQKIEAVHVITVHDLPDWNQASAKAAKSVEDALARNREVQVVIDIHRDAIPAGEPPGYAQVTAGNTTYARMLLVVGTVDNPLAQENIRFAEALRDKLEEKVPGITRGVRVMQQETNGRFKEKSVTVFIGDHQDNTVAEANASAQVLAQAIAELI